MIKIAIVRNDAGNLGEYISNRFSQLLGKRCMTIDAREGFPHDVKTWSSSNNVIGVILGGSRASVNDGDAWIAEELEFAGRIIDLYLPILGICFGHQILGKLFGADIERKAMKLKDSNVYGVQFHPCYDNNVKKIKELGISDSNYREHEGEKVLRNFFRIAGV